MESPLKIKSFEHLFDILVHSENVREFYVTLNNGAKSWKNLTFCNRKDRYGRRCIVVHSELDDLTRTYTIKNLMGDKYTCIASAIRCGSFYLYDNNENHDKSDIKYY